MKGAACVCQCGDNCQYGAKIPERGRGGEVTVYAGRAQVER